MPNQSSDKPVKTAVITGGHFYEVVHFHRLFRGLAGIDAYIQHIDDFCASPEAMRDSYDVLVFYHFIKGGPPVADNPWHSGRQRKIVERLTETGQGLVILHHALLAYPQWPLWSEIAGIVDRSFQYYHDESLRINVSNANHFITRGLQDWDMVDETYTVADAGEGSEILLTADHPRSMKTIAWTRQYKKNRVFCFESGHDHLSWDHPSFQEVLRRGILWCAGQM